MCRRSAHSISKFCPPSAYKRANIAMAKICKRLKPVGAISSYPMSFRLLATRTAPLRSFHAGPTTVAAAAATRSTTPYNCRFIFRNSNNLPRTTSSTTAATVGCMSSASLGLLRKLVSRTATQTSTSLKPNPSFFLSQARSYTTFKEIMSGLFLSIKFFLTFCRTEENQGRQSSRRTRWRRTNQSYLGHDQETAHPPIFGY
jgi:hypothetical protein